MLKRLLSQLCLIKNKLLSHVPTPLPVGATEFETWVKSVLDLTGRYADEDSMKFALASMIIHYDHKVSCIPKKYFVNCLRKAAANQVASQVFQDIKLKQQAAQEAAKAAADTAATTQVATSDTKTT